MSSGKATMIDPDEKPVLRIRGHRYSLIGNAHADRQAELDRGAQCEQQRITASR